jgi:hypothetical protein
MSGMSTGAVGALIHRWQRMHRHIECCRRVPVCKRALAFVMQRAQLCGAHTITSSLLERYAISRTTR